MTDRSAYFKAYREKNIEKIKAAQKVYDAANKEEKAKRMAAYYKKNKERIDARNSAWRTANPDKVAILSKRWRVANPEKANENTASWYRSNPLARKAKDEKYRKEFPWKRGAVNAKRRAAKLRATPAWADEFIVEEIYMLSQMRSSATGIKWHVDHIVPLQSKIVCGLHCEQNMQVIPGSENIRKHNKYWPNMPEDCE